MPIVLTNPVAAPSITTYRIESLTLIVEGSGAGQHVLAYTPIDSNGNAGATTLVTLKASSVAALLAAAVKGAALKSCVYAALTSELGTAGTVS